jgi:hypothetical protein
MLAELFTFITRQWKFRQFVLAGLIIIFGGAVIPHFLPVMFSGNALTLSQALLSLVVILFGGYLFIHWLIVSLESYTSSNQ